MVQVRRVLDQVAGGAYDTVLAGTLYTLPSVRASSSGSVLFDMLITALYVSRNRFYFGLL